MNIKYNPITEFVLNEVDTHGIISPYARFLTNSFLGKLSDTFSVISGDFTYPELELETVKIGALDYCGFFIFRGLGIFLNDYLENNKQPVVWDILLIIILFATLFIDVFVRALMAAVITLVVSPIVLITHLITLPIRANIKVETANVLASNIKLFKTNEDGNFGFNNQAELYGDYMVKSKKNPLDSNSIIVGVQPAKRSASDNPWFFKSFKLDKGSDNQVLKQLGKLNEVNLPCIGL
jgi:hypothetical protein